MDSSSGKKPNVRPGSIVYNNPHKGEEGLLEDVSVRSVKRSITKKILIFMIGIFLIPLFVFIFSVTILPLLKSSTFAGVTLNYWGLWEDKSILENQIRAFETLHPNITINYQQQDIKTEGGYVDRLATRINNGTGPDIFRFHNSWTDQIKDLLLPLPQSTVDSTQLATQYYDVVRQDVNRNGAYYGIPLEIDTLALFVNDEMLKGAGIQNPSTWDDMVKAAGELTVKGQGNSINRAGAALGIYNNVSHAADILSLLMYQNGVRFDNFGSPQTTANIQDALSFYTSFAQSNVWNDTFENSTLAFAKGKVAMVFGYSWDVIAIKNLNPNLSFSVLRVPHLPGRSTTIASYWVEGVSSRTKHPKEAFEFLSFLASKESMEALYAQEAKQRLVGEPYPRKDMASLLASDKLVYPFVQQAGDAVTTPFSSDTFDGAQNTSLDGYLSNAIQTILSYRTTQSATNVLVNGVNQVMSRYAK